MGGSRSHCAMPTASAAHKTGWQPYSSTTDPILQHKHTHPKYKKVRVPVDRRRVPGIAASSSSSSALSSSKAPEIWAKLTWEDHLEVLRRYVQREGHADVPLEHEEEGVRLGVWLSRQWAEYSSTTRGGYLSEGRKIRLADAGVIWNGPAPPASGVIGPKYLNERKWDDRKDYDAAANHCRPRIFDVTKPASEGSHWRPYSAESDPHLSGWLQRQRTKGLTHGSRAWPKPTEERYIPPNHPVIPGLDKALAKRLKEAAQAHIDAEQERRSRRQQGGSPMPAGV